MRDGRFNINFQMHLPLISPNPEFQQEVNLAKGESINLYIVGAATFKQKIDSFSLIVNKKQFHHLKPHNSSKRFGYARMDLLINMAKMKPNELFNRQ